MKATVVITSANEPQSIKKAIHSFQEQTQQPHEIWVVAPDEETLSIASSLGVKTIKDPGKGKSFALNLVFQQIDAEILILSDGDVFVNESAVEEIIKPFEDKKIGCVSGRPVPQEDKKTKYGYFANFLFDAAHQLRLERWENKEFIEVSGYLWAFRNGLITEIPKDVAEDSIVPLMINEKGLRIGYAENAKVYVKNVDNLKDWLSQKIRTAKAHKNLHKYFPNRPIMKSFFQESKGIIKLFSYPKNFKEFFWLAQLIIMRGYMWYKTRTGREYSDGWSRVESTK